MKKRVIKKNKFCRSSAQNRALMQGLFRSLVKNKEIKTTEAKAKALKTYADRVISKVKKEKAFENKSIFKYFKPSFIKEVKEVADKYEKRVGGYTQVIKLSDIRKDAAKIAIIKLV